MEYCNKDIYMMTITSPHPKFGGGGGNFSYTSYAILSMNHLKLLHLCSRLNSSCLDMSPIGYPRIVGSLV